jgi:MFS family permease
MAHQRNFWIPVICGAIILTIGIGARQSFGIFQKPIAADLNVGRELWSFSNALALLLMGVFAPFAGNLADRFGTAPTVGAGSALYVTGMLMIAMAGEGVMLTVGNALAGIGMAAAGFGPILGAIGRQTPVEWRSSALGIATAGGSFGQFAIVPFASILQNRLDNWHSTMFVLAAVSVMMVPLSVGLRENRAAPSKAAGARRPQSSKDALQEAFRTQGFWLLTIGFFVCGFHVTFIGLHLPSYISDNSVGLSFFGRPISAIELGGWAIGLVGLFNIVGSLLWGWLGGHHLRKDMLALLYALRALAFVLFLALPLSWISVLLFAASLGFLWLGTVPLTSGLVGYMFGPVHMSMLWGIVFFSHQFGSFLGGWGAGRLYDIQGNYDLIWWISVGLGVFAALIHWFIREQPVERLTLVVVRS